MAHDSPAFQTHQLTGSLTLNMQSGTTSVAAAIGAAAAARRMRAVKAHGALMLLAFVVFLPMGILAARHKWLAGNKKVGIHTYFGIVCILAYQHSFSFCHAFVHISIEMFCAHATFIHGHGIHIYTQYVGVYEYQIIANNCMYVYCIMHVRRLVASVPVGSMLIVHCKYLPLFYRLLVLFLLL